MQTGQNTLQSAQIRSGPIITTALYLFFIANVGRTLAILGDHPALHSQSGWILGVELVFISLFSLVIWRTGLPHALLHVYFTVQSILIVAIFGFFPEMDFINSLFVMLSYQAALLFSGRIRWSWIIVFVALTGGSAVLFHGPLRGLGLGLSSMAAEIVLTALIIAGQQVEIAQARSQAILEELQRTHQQLTQYANRVEELAAIEERNRLARELHDSVSQTMFSIILNARAAQLLLEKDPARVRTQLEQLQILTQAALAEMRSLITHLRLKPE